MTQVEVSAREAEVLAALADHRSNAQIARLLHISVRTVESHVSSLLRKYGVADRRELADLAGSRRGPGIAGLPASRTTFVGRTAESTAVLDALEQARLVTLLGPGGMGKTRLAAMVAAVLAGPGAFVNLVPIRDGMVARAVAAAFGVTERPPQTLEQVLVERLRVGRSLLVLDNCEHVVEEVAALVERLLAACPGTTVLATSRERLGVPGEQTVLLPPLAADSDAVELFTDRARAVDPSFAADSGDVSDVCARLDGMPLAIELAAARIGSLGLDGLRTALGDRLRLLAGGRGADPRHRSLGAVIGWSHDLLDDEEQLLFRRLAVYVGGFDLEAACATSPDLARSEVADLLGRLTDKSLVTRGGSRWRLLETVREFALSRLTDDELATARDRHLRWAATTAAELENQVDGSAWRSSYDEVVGDLRAALAGTVAEPDPTAHRLARSLGHLAFAGRGFVEAVGHYRAAADRAEDGVAAARDLRTAADATIAVSDGQAGVRLLLDAAERAVAEGNVRAAMLASAVIAINRYPAGPMFDLPTGHSGRLLSEAAAGAVPADPHVAALLAAAKAWEHGDRRIGADAVLAQQAVDAARRAGDPVLIAGALDALGTAAGNAGRLREARSYALERMRLVESLPRHEPYAASEIIDAYHVASTTAIATGDLPAALSVARAAVADDPTGDHPYISLPRLIRVYALTGRFDACLEQADALWNRWQRAGSPAMEWMSSAAAAAALVHGLRDDGSFGEWQARALELARTDDPWTAPSLAAPAVFAQARVAVQAGPGPDTAELVSRAFADFSEHWWAPYARAAGAELAVVAGLPDAADRVAAAGSAAAENDWAAACLTRAAARLSGDPGEMRSAVEAFERIDARFERACTLLLTPDGDADGRAELAELRVPIQTDRSGM
ncbi:MAG TPA: LuxR C-terminal-related transcriptional regulator [Kribbella sp.]|nr:LuxR C-terminal-related transcriptional regulator [Kribbella sp.]